MFKGVYRVPRKLADGSTRMHYYAWRGGPKLSGDPLYDEAAAREFLDLTQRKPEQTAQLFAGLVQRFTASPDFMNRSKDWRKESRQRHQILIEKFGSADIAYFERREMRKHILALRDKHADKPRTADKIMTELTAILNWAKDRGEIGPHVAEKVGKLYSVDRSEIIWETAEIEAVCALMKPAQQWPILLAAYTGLDLGDLCALPWSAIGAFDIQTKRGKTGQRAMPPILPEARAVLDSIPKIGPKVLTNTRGLPWTPKGYSATFRKIKAKTGITKRFKDFRGTACTNFLSAGMTVDEAADAMGWTRETVDRMARIYVHREKVASAVVERLRNKTVNGLLTASKGIE